MRNKFDTSSDLVFAKDTKYMGQEYKAGDSIPDEMTTSMRQRLLGARKLVVASDAKPVVVDEKKPQEQLPKTQAYELEHTGGGYYNVLVGGVALNGEEKIQGKDNAEEWAKKTLGITE